MSVFRSTTRTASSVRLTAKTCLPALSPTLLWCTRSHPSTPCLKGLLGPPPSLPVQVCHTCKDKLVITTLITSLCLWCELCSNWQTTPPQPANPLTPPTPAACRPPPQHTIMEPCPFLTSDPLALRTAGTAGWWTAGRQTRPVRGTVGVREFKGNLTS